MRNILVAVPYSREALDELSRVANLYWLRDMNEKELDALLPSIDAVFVQFWPKELGPERLARMTSLSFVQTGLAGVNHIPFQQIPPEVRIASNAGGYSDEVGEFAWALLLAAAKRVLKFSRTVEESATKSPLELGREVVVLKGRILGVLGYGGIGSSVARIARAFEMKVLAFSRTKTKEVVDGVVPLVGATGFEEMLRNSDVLVLALPLTKGTTGMIGREELKRMKRTAILVNVARAEVVEQRAIFEYLRENKEFVYCTDVWWTRDGKEVYPPELPFLDLENFIGTPHVAGPSAVATGGPLRNSLDNLLRYVRGEPVRNVVDRADYV